MSQPTERFSQIVTDDDLACVVQNSKPINTQRQEIWAANIWSEWSMNRQTVNGSNSKFNTPPKDLSGFKNQDEIEYWIKKFILEAKNSNGADYIPSTLKCILSAIFSNYNV